MSNSVLNHWDTGKSSLKLWFHHQFSVKLVNYIRKFNVHHMLACISLWIILEPHNENTFARSQHLVILVQGEKSGEDKKEK